MELILIKYSFECFFDLLTSRCSVFGASSCLGATFVGSSVGSLIKSEVVVNFLLKASILRLFSATRS